jgi:ATP-binding cassette subfamily F protein 3
MAEAAPAKVELPPPPARPATPKKPVNPVKLAAAEKRVGELEAEVAELDRRLADPSHMADAGRLAQLGREREDMARQLEQAEQAWLALLEEAG